MTSTDKQIGFLLLNPRKELVVLTKKLLEACPSVAPKPLPPQDPIKGPVVISRELFNKCVKWMKVGAAHTSKKGLLVVNALYQLGKLDALELAGKLEC